MAHYMSSVKQGTWKFPDYSSCCPLCGAADCAIRHGFYYRALVIIDFQLVTDVPIPRYLCRNLASRGNKTSPHRTFSLLPDKLAPYQRFDLNCMFQTLDFLCQPTNPTYQQTCTFINLKGQNSDIPLETHQIHHFQLLFQQAFTKLSTCPELARGVVIAYHDDPVRSMLDVISQYRSPFLTTTSHTRLPIQHLAWDFVYNFQTEPWPFRHFLFGIPSQKRI
jgi:hypothetical protein